MCVTSIYEVWFVVKKDRKRIFEWIYHPQPNQVKLTVWNLKLINGRFKSNQSMIFLLSSSGKITINELPILRTTISEL